ncbi:MAG: VWA domain-containing protein [Verrucomicrobiales bacterium]|nr:VWA domain-containing protein [Verrucomicrobiales bacterium]
MKSDRIRLFYSALCLLATFTTVPLLAQSESGKSIIILDASGSMWGQIDGEPKIEIAREVIADLMTTLDPDVEIGLMAYGHREKGNCEDIELLSAPSKGDRAGFLAKVNSIIPKGKTPLTSAVEQAAQFLKYEEEAANIILVSDGLETCDEDPCVLAGELAAKGINFKAHIVAFDLTAEESDSFRCLADETGGEFLQAQNASTLKDALEMAIDALMKPSGEVMPEPKRDPATIKAPETVPAGAEFEVEWAGPDNKGDYLTIVSKDAEEGVYGNYTYTRKGSPLTLTAPVDPGLCEVRYLMSEGERQVLGRVDIEVIPVSASLEAPEEVVAGSGFNVDWKGPDNKGDYITIVPRGAEKGAYESYAYTGKGNPAEIRALSVPGLAEVRYVTGQGKLTLASREITVTEADVLVSGPEVVDAGASLVIDWVGPGNQGDYITIVKQGADEGTYHSYFYTKNSDDGKVEITALEEVGDDYEVRYVEGQDKKTLASYPISIRPVTASVEGPESAVSGSEVEIKWSGPEYKGWYITIVEKSAEAGTYTKYFYTGNEESPTKLQSPELVGPCEIRFVSADRNIVASTPIEMIAAVANFTETPEKVAAKEEFRVKWEGPDNARDYITIVEASAEDGKYGDYIYVERGQDQDLTAPDEPGDYEIRYVTSQKKTVLARERVKVVAE